MLQFGNKEFRNLEEQVEKNAQDIQDFKDGNQTIAEFGITVVGILATADELPAQGENYGDAYLIGSSTPYDMRVWTRDVANNTAKWVDLGAFPLQGPKGDKGDIGSIIYADSGEPLNNPTGDYQFYINTTTGYWYVSFEASPGVYQWAKRFTLKGEKGDRGEQGKQGVQGLTGPQGKVGPIGPQGQKGDKGDVGPAFNVQGTLASTANLPTPTAAMQDAGYAYLIPDESGIKHIWVIQGSTSFSWVDVGAAGVGVKGEDGVPGVGIDSLSYTDLTLGNLNVSYNTTDGIMILGKMRQIYDEGQTHDSNMELEIPIKGGDNITIDKSSDSEFVEVKLDQTQDITILGNATENGGYFTIDNSNLTSNTKGTLYTSFGMESGTSQIIHKDLGGTARYKFPNVYASQTVLTTKNVKTLFGNQSIHGSGNIDLYQHNITFKSSDFEAGQGQYFGFTIISSKSLKVDSLTDLKTLLGNTFEYPVSGYSMTGEAANAVITRINQKGYAVVASYNAGYFISYPAGTWTDIVTTV